MSNQLFYGDNLEVLRRYIKDETVDLCYIDPPFNSKRNYEVLKSAEKQREVKQIALDLGMSIEERREEGEVFSD